MPYPKVTRSFLLGMMPGDKMICSAATFKDLQSARSTASQCASLYGYYYSVERRGTKTVVVKCYARKPRRRHDTD